MGKTNETNRTTNQPPCNYLFTFLCTKEYKRYLDDLRETMGLTRSVKRGDYLKLAETILHLAGMSAGMKPPKRASAGRGGQRPGAGRKRAAESEAEADATAEEESKQSGLDS
jgi:hypothetical protein